jgi:hypothetical protein
VPQTNLVVTVKNIVIVLKNLVDDLITPMAIFKKSGIFLHEKNNPVIDLENLVSVSN